MEENKQKNRLCAAVLAGGFGTRLSPLTDSIPKPLMKILDSTVLEHTVEKLKKAGDFPITVSSFYKWEMIKEHMKEYEGVRVIHEAVPLGTAGGAKLCMREDAENLLVLSGDGIFDFDLEQIVNFHFDTSADVTIVSTHSENPTRFGVILGDDNGKVCEIMEKPSWRNVVTNVVNTGIYLLSKRAVDCIPDGVCYDFSKDLFPKLLKCGYDIRTVTLDGYWCDMGTPGEYLGCNIDACFGRIKTLPNSKNQTQNLVNVGIHAKDPTYLGENAVIGCNVFIEKGLVAGKNCSIGDNSGIARSVFGDNVKIGKGSDINGVLTGDEVTVGENCIIGEGCIIESGSKIEQGTVLEGNITVLRDGSRWRNGGFEQESVLFKDDGEVFFTGENIKERLFKLGGCVAKAINSNKKTGCSVGVISECGDLEFGEEFIRGCTSDGGEVYVFKDGDKSCACFASVYLPCDVTVCLSDLGGGVKIEIMSLGGIKLSDMLERKITTFYYSVNKDGQKSTNDCGKVRKISGIKDMYICVLKRMGEYMLGNCDGTWVRAKVNEGENNENTPLEQVLCMLESKKAENGRKICVTINENGFSVGDKTAVADEYHVYAAVLSNLGYIGINKAYIHESCPDVYRYILKRKGMGFVSLSENSEFIPPENMLGLLVLCDRSFCTMALVCIMTVRRMGLSELMEEIPSFEIYSDMYVAGKNRASSMEKLCRLYGIGNRRGSGVTLQLSDGNVTVIPDRINGFRIISEAMKTETAKEICHRIANAIIKDDDKNK